MEVCVMAKGSNIYRVTEYIENRLIQAVDKKAMVGYYNRPRPDQKERKHFRVMANGVAKRV
jgi:hypothetical protein